MRVSVAKTGRLTAMAFLLGLALVPAASANVTITPTNVLIEGRQRYADVNLINDADTQNSYEINWRFFRMEELTGAYVEQTTPTTDFDLTQNIIFTPKRMSLPPKGMQKVRFGLRLKGEPPAPGDYRAHIEFKQAGTVTANHSPSVKKDTVVGIGLTVGFSIPVIYRVGESDALASFGQITTQINPKTQKIEAIIPVNRSDSKFGLLGHLFVYYNDKKVGELRNANVFPEIRSRVFALPLEVTSLSGGRLRIVYSEQDRSSKLDKSKVGIMAEKTIQIGR